MSNNFNVFKKVTKSDERAVTAMEVLSPVSEYLRARGVDLDQMTDLRVPSRPVSGAVAQRARSTAASDYVFNMKMALSPAWSDEFAEVVNGATLADSQKGAVNVETTFAYSANYNAAAEAAHALSAILADHPELDAQFRNLREAILHVPFLMADATAFSRLNCEPLAINRSLDLSDANVIDAPPADVDMSYEGYYFMPAFHAARMRAIECNNIAARIADSEKTKDAAREEKYRDDTHVLDDQPNPRMFSALFIGQEGETATESRLLIEVEPEGTDAHSLPVLMVPRIAPDSQQAPTRAYWYSPVPALSNIVAEIGTSVSAILADNMVQARPIPVREKSASLSRAQSLAYDAELREARMHNASAEIANAALALDVSDVLLKTLFAYNRSLRMTINREYEARSFSTVNASDRIFNTHIRDCVERAFRSRGGNIELYGDNSDTMSQATQSVLASACAMEVPASTTLLLKALGYSSRSAEVNHAIAARRAVMARRS